MRQHPLAPAAPSCGCCSSAEAQQEVRQVKHRGQQVKNSSREARNVWAAAIKDCVKAFWRSAEPPSSRTLEGAQQKQRMSASNYQEVLHGSHAEALSLGKSSLQSCKGTMRQACKLILLHALTVTCTTGLPLPRTSARGAGRNPAIPTSEIGALNLTVSGCSLGNCCTFPVQYVCDCSLRCYSQSRQPRCVSACELIVLL